MTTLAAANDATSLRRIVIQTPLAVGPVNAYVLRGAPLTLVDTGPNTDAAYASVRDGLAAAGCGIADLERIVLTHGHVDHCGLAARLQEESGARVLVHEAGVSDLVDWPRTWRQRLRLVERAAEVGGVPADLSRTWLELNTPRESLGASIPADALQALADGQRPLWGGRTWQVLHTPGHAADHVCLVDAGDDRPTGEVEREAVMIAGDLLLRHLPSPPLLEPRRPDGRRPETLASLIASWRRIGKVRVDIAWPGHGPPVRAPRIRLARSLAEARDGVRATRAALVAGARSPWEVAMHTGLPSEAERLALVMGWVVARLDWLVDRGLAERRFEGDALRFEPAAPTRRGIGPR